MNHPDNYKEAYEEMRDLFEAMKGKLDACRSELKTCRNELCLRCGNYREKHKGACDGCRWKDLDALLGE